MSNKQAMDGEVGFCAWCLSNTFVAPDWLRAGLVEYAQQ
jgi:hypothetical protein